MEGYSGIYGRFFLGENTVDVKKTPGGISEKISGRFSKLMHGGFTEIIYGSCF